MTRGTFCTKEAFQKFGEKESERIKAGIPFLLQCYARVEKFQHGRRRDRPKKRAWMVTNNCVDLMHKIFVPEDDRLTIDEVIGHPWFDDIRDATEHEIKLWQKQQPWYEKVSKELVSTTI